MFGFLKKKDKNKETEDLAWGAVGTNRKMSAQEQAKEEAEQADIERRGKERRDMYRPAGTERIFTDATGHHIALRVEENSSMNNGSHPPLAVLAFWGARQIGAAHCEMQDSHLKIFHYETFAEFDKKGIADELLKELESYARTKGYKSISATLPAPNTVEWDEAFFTRCGFARNGEEFQKSV